MTKILLTGASGYIGNQLLDRLLENDQFSISIITRNSTDTKFNRTYNNRVKVYEYTGFDSLYELMKNKEKIDLVIHLAGYVKSGNKHNEVTQNIEANLVLTTHILEAMRLTGTTNIINTGSYWEYNEEGENKPKTPYSIFKSASRNILGYYSTAFAIHYINIILYDVYGKNDPRDKIIPFISKIKENEILNLTGGEQELSFTYIDDVVKGYLTAINFFKVKDQNYINQTYHLRGDEFFKLKDVIRRFLYISKKNIKVNYGSIPYSTHQIMTLPKNVPIMPNWKAKISLDEGLSTIIGLDY